MGIQFVHLLALSLWIGGIVVIQEVLMPIRAQAAPTPLGADHFLAKIFLKFDQITLFCAGALMVTGIIKFWRWENLTPWNLTRYTAIALMSVIAIYTAIKISPKRIQNVVQAHSGTSGESQENLDRLSTRLMRINLICGAAALLMA